MQDSFRFTDDGHGGTLVVAATPTAYATVASKVSNFAAYDSFVFLPNYGNIILTEIRSGDGHGAIQ